MVAACASILTIAALAEGLAAWAERTSDPPSVPVSTRRPWPLRRSVPCAAAVPLTRSTIPFAPTSPETVTPGT